jgi:hypothetical protein
LIAATTGFGAAKIASTRARKPSVGGSLDGGGRGASFSRSPITDSSSTS